MALTRHTRTYEEYWSGPLPHPDQLEAYEAIEPGLASRIVAMSEQTLATANYIDRKSLDEDAASVRRGQWLVAGVQAGSVVGAVVLALLHQPAVAGGCIAVPILLYADKLVRTVRGTAKGTGPSK